MMLISAMLMGLDLLRGLLGRTLPSLSMFLTTRRLSRSRFLAPRNPPRRLFLPKTIKEDYNCSYSPDKPGNYEVHVTFGGKHIPGSVFHVSVLPEISLGGEGKIRVFYSTTSSSEKGRRDVFDLQRLLEQKKVHEVFFFFFFLIFCFCFCFVFVFAFAFFFFFFLFFFSPATRF